MKKITTTIFFVLLIIDTTQAQSWNLFKADTVHYLKHRSHNFGAYTSSNTIGLSVLIDTVYQRNASEVTVLKKDYSHINNLNMGFGNCTSLSPSVFGDSIVSVLDTSFFFVNSSNYIRWENNASTWVFYSDISNNQLLINLDSTVVNGTDSLRYYSFNSVVSGTHPLQQFDTAQFILSKHNGLIKGFDFSTFPDSLEVMDLFKLDPLTYRDIYDYNPGDVYHYTHHRHGSQAMSLDDQFIMKVINIIQHNPDSVTYEFERTVYDEYDTVIQGQTTKKSKSYIDTVTAGYDLSTRIGTGSFIDTIDLYENFEIGFFNDYYSAPAYSKMPYTVLQLDSTKLCNYAFEHYEKIDYVFGVGRFSHMEDYSQASFHDNIEQLVYYKKGNTSWGTPLVITVGLHEEKNQMIKVYPNPVEDQLTIEGILTNWNYEIIDVSGQTIKTGLLKPALNRIPLEDLNSGVYFIKMNSGDQYYNHKIVIK